MLALPCSAQDLVYVTTQANAIARAKAEGKLIMADFGRPSCSDCVAMQSRFQLLSPPLKQWIQASCVWWNSDVDTSSEYVPYLSGMDGPAYPVICFVDPANPGTFAARYQGLQSSAIFLINLKTYALKYLPVVVTNLPGVPLTNLVNGSFVVMGVAQTNAAAAGSISNAPISAVMWRLNGAGSFQAATGTTSWSAQVSLPHGTNTFESYVQYSGPKNSWTNRVTLINLGSGGPILQPQAITFNSLPDHTYGDGSITLIAIGGGSTSPVIFTNTGPATISGSVLTITGAGLVTVTANQAGDATYSAAPPVSESFMVNKATPVVIATGGNFTFDGTAKAGSGTAHRRCGGGSGGDVELPRHRQHSLWPNKPGTDCGRHLHGDGVHSG